MQWGTTRQFVMEQQQTFKKSNFKNVSNMVDQCWEQAI